MNRCVFLLIPALTMGALSAQPYVRCENPIANVTSTCNITWKVSEALQLRLVQVGTEYNKHFVAGVDIVASNIGATGTAAAISRLLALPTLDAKALSIAELDELFVRAGDGNLQKSNSKQARISIVTPQAFVSDIGLYRSNLLPAMVELEGKLFLVERLKWDVWPIKRSEVFIQSADLLAIENGVRLSIDRSKWEQVRFVCVATLKN